MRRLRILAAAAALATAVACAGCGLGPGAGSASVDLRVTEGFGAHTLTSVDAGRTSGQLTDMQLLERHARVQTRYGGGYVESIDGHAGTSDDVDWFFYVNGILAPKGAAATKIHRGDHVWFDLHDWRATGSDATPAIVGSFPEPFSDGSGGRRYPSTISWANGEKANGAIVQAEFARLHISLSPTGPGYGANDVLSVNVGTWGELYGEVAAELLKYGPGSSGVYAHFSDGGRQLDLEDAAGNVVRRLGPGWGLVAAVATTQDPVPTWLVTGTDRAGVTAAARAVNAADLADHFAVAVHGTTVVPVPLSGSG